MVSLTHVYVYDILDYILNLSTHLISRLLCQGIVNKISDNSVVSGTSIILIKLKKLFREQTILFTKKIRR